MDVVRIIAVVVFRWRHGRKLSKDVEECGLAAWVYLSMSEGGYGSSDWAGESGSSGVILQDVKML